MIWNAADRSFSWKPNGLELELELEGSILTVRQGGTSFQIDVASPTVEMTLHHFAVGHGSFLRLRAGATEVTVGVQAYAATDNLYSDEPLKDYRYSLAKSDFETFHKALADVRRAVSPLAPSDLLRERRSFLLRGNTNVYRGLLTAGLVVGSVMVLATIAVKLFPWIVTRHSEVLIVIGQIGIVFGLLRWFWWSMQQTKSALLIVQGQTLTLSRLKPPMIIRSWKHTEADVKLTVWKSPSSRSTSSQLFPVVEVRIRNERVLSVALHAQKLSPGAPRGRCPRYWIDWLWSATFFDCVVPETVKKGLSIEPVLAP
jgi:hypothetical protein